MSEQRSEKQCAKLVVVTSDAGMAVNIGGPVATHARTFDLPPEISNYILSQRSTYTSVTFALDISEVP